MVNIFISSGLRLTETRILNKLSRTCNDGSCDKKSLADAEKTLGIRQLDQIIIGKMHLDFADRAVPRIRSSSESRQIRLPKGIDSTILNLDKRSAMASLAFAAGASSLFMRFRCSSFSMWSEV